MADMTQMAKLRASLSKPQASAFDALQRKAASYNELRRNLAEQTEPINVAVRLAGAAGVGAIAGWADARFGSVSLGEMEFDPSDVGALGTGAAALATGDKMTEEVAKVGFGIAAYKRSNAYWLDKLPENEEGAAA